jgi:hypothetical protein
MSKSGRTLALRGAIAGISLLCAQVAAAGPQRAVVELFTAQGCSSCPPADAMVGRLCADPSVLVLSFHVNYWDRLGWKDPFSSQVNTDRQYAYAHTLGEPTVATPQVIVNGTQSVLGAQESVVRRAVAAANQANFPVEADLSKQPDGSFTLHLGGLAMKGDVWEVRYVRYAATQVRAGENGGRTLETYNNVTHIRRLGAFAPGTLSLPPLKSPEDGIAVFVQAPDKGPMLGATAYQVTAG